MKMQKQTYSILFLFLTLIVKAQIGINTEMPRSAAAILDFKQDPNNTTGMVLPIVDNTATNMVAGTLLLDKSDKRIKYKTRDEWVSLSYVEGNLDKHIPNLSPDTKQSTYIGDAPNLAVQGVLVLESTNKAMILPHVKDPIINVKNPYPGMICYDPTTKALFLYDGRYWNIWRKSSDL